MAQNNFTSDIDTDNNSGKQHTRLRGRSASHLLLMDAIDSSEEEEKVPLPVYERLSQSMRSPEDEEVERMHAQSPVQKPIAWKLIDKVFKKDGEKEKEREKDDSAANKEKKKRSSWLPDPEKRWPIQGWT